MNVAQPIRSVIPTVDGPVYVALAGTTAPLTLTQVHRIAGHSIERVRLVLKRMLGAGLVFEVPGGYLLNRDHLAAPAIECLATLHGQLLERIKAKVLEWAGEVDLLVVSGAADLDDFTSELSDAVRRWTGNDAQVVGLSPAVLRRLRRAKEPIVTKWEKDLIVVCGDRRVLKAPQ
jgi:hypothetical protein